MKLHLPCIAYIDGANLYKGLKELNIALDYKKFRIWMRHKYQVSEVYVFLGFLPAQKEFYEALKALGYILIFKETTTHKGITKGNADAEMVLECVKNVYEKKSHTAILVSGDGDFSCLVDFLLEKSIFNRLLIPNRKYSSYLLRKKQVRLVYLEEAHIVSHISQ